MANPHETHKYYVTDEEEEETLFYDDLDMAKRHAFDSSRHSDYEYYVFTCLNGEPLACYLDGTDLTETYIRTQEAQFGERYWEKE